MAGFRGVFCSEEFAQEPTNDPGVWSPVEGQYPSEVAVGKAVFVQRRFIGKKNYQRMGIRERHTTDIP